MASLIYKFEDFEIEITYDPLLLAIKFLLWKYNGAKKLAYKLGVGKNAINVWQRKIQKPNKDHLRQIWQLVMDK